MIKIWKSCLRIYNRAFWLQELLSDLKSSAHNYTQHNTVLSHQIITLWGMGQMLLVMGVIILIRVIMILITIGTGPSLRQPPATVTLLTTIIVIFDNFHNKYLYWAAKCHLCIKTSLGSELLCLGGSTRRPNGGGGVAKQLGDRSNAHTWQIHLAASATCCHLAPTCWCQICSNNGLLQFGRWLKSAEYAACCGAQAVVGGQPGAKWDPPRFWGQPQSRRTFGVALLISTWV